MGDKLDFTISTIGFSLFFRSILENNNMIIIRRLRIAARDIHSIVMCTKPIIEGEIFGCGKIMEKDASKKEGKEEKK